ncbi:alpha/beta hydrolase [Actinophytocola sp.]|uniref:alpha/beta hydrolase n=1 Tax=Actinophytocola sp. TaxID=1872138 RepID=UPI002DDD7E6C|nr:alpha/beta hydrolase [Actinophytocola sp.]
MFQRRLIYLPSEGPVPSAGTVLPGARDVSYETADGLRLAGWFVPATGRERGVSVLVAPGNGGDRSLRAPLAKALRGRGMSVLLVDYRGYGGNPGDPSEEGLALDVRAARAFLVAERPADRVIYFGESLGAAVVTELAVEHPPDGLLLRSPFFDLPAVAGVHYPLLPVRALLRDRFPVADRIGRVRAPTVVVLGTADDIVPPEQSRAVAAAAPGRATLVEVAGANHNDAALLDGPELIGAVEKLAG